jgi:hypothetical protein
MTFGFALMLAGFVLLDAGWKGTTPFGVLQGVTAGTSGAGGVLGQTGQSVLASFTGKAAPGGAVPFSKNVSGYVNPFGSGATSGRIDQGKDVGGSGPIRAVGNARVISTGAPGWPGGGGVLYELLDGPDAGKFIYTYEGIQATVRAGEKIAAGTIIGHIIPGTSTGIETGWANKNGEPISHSEYTEGKETIGGKSFAHFLEQLGFK